MAYENLERARELFDAGYYKEEEKGLIQSLLELGDDKVERAREYYNQNCTGGTKKELTREEAEGMLEEYSSNRKEWKQSADVSSEGSIVGFILSLILVVLFILVWLAIRYGKLLIKNYKQSKIVDAMELRKIAPELEDKCASYREALKDLKTCPKRIKALAGTNTVMSAAGAVCIILSVFNFVAYYLRYHTGMLVPIAIMFGMQMVLGLALLARHKFSAGILFLVQTITGVFVMSFDFLVPQRPNSKVYEMWRFNISNGVNVTGLIVIILFVVLSVAMMIYYISSAKNKVIEGILFAGYMGCSIFARGIFMQGFSLGGDMNPNATRMVYRTMVLTDNGIVLSVAMLEFAWFVIVYLMLKGKKKLNVTE